MAWICLSCGHVNDNDLTTCCGHCAVGDDPERVKAREDAAQKRAPAVEFEHKPSGRFTKRH